MRKWYKEKPNEEKTKEYAAFRHQVDRFTNSMCPKYSGIKQCMEPGAEIYNADISDNNSDDDSEEEAMSDTEEETNYYHCHKSCVNYETLCRSPEKCKQQKQENKPCPIKKILGEHLCGDKKKIPEKDRINRGRKSDQ